MRWRGPRTRRPAQRCDQCGAEAPGDARWCGACGAALGRTAPPTADEVATPPDDHTGHRDGRGGRLLAAGTVAAVLVGLLVAQNAQPEPVTPAGYGSRGDGARTGVVSLSTPPEPAGVAWRTSVALPPLLTVGADVIDTTTTADGRELVVVLDPAETGQRVTTHDAASGEVVSTTMLPLVGQPYVVAVGSGLLVHRALRSATLVDVTTGERRWTIEGRFRDDAAVLGAGVALVPQDPDDLVVALHDLDDGTELWRTAVDSGTGRVVQLLATPDAVITLTADGGRRLTALDATTGERRWSLLETTGLPTLETFPTGPVVTDGRSVLVLGDGRAVAVDVATGSPTELTLPEGFRPATGAIEGELVLVSDAADRLVALDRATGDVRWESTVTGAPVFSVTLRDDVIAIRTDNGTTLVDADTGATISRVAPGGGTTRLVVTSDGGVARVTTAAEVEVVGGDGVRWRSPTVAVHLPDIATDAGTAAVTTPDGVEVLDITDGQRRFAHEAFQDSLVVAGSLTAPALDGVRVTVAPPETQPTDRGGLLSLFADTGILDWARRDDRVVPRGTPVLDRDLHILPVGSQVLGYDRTSGVRRLVVETSIARTDVAAAEDWIVAVDAPRDVGDVWVGRRSDRRMVFRAPVRTCAPPVIHDGLALLSTHLGDLIARTLEDGEQPWGERARGSACRPLSIADDTLVALVDDRDLLGVSLDAGDTTWRATLGATAAGAPVVAGDLVLVPTLAGTIEAWTVGADEPTWTVDVGAVPAGSVAVDGDTLLVQTRDGQLVALR